MDNNFSQERQYTEQLIGKWVMLVIKAVSIIIGISFFLDTIDYGKDISLFNILLGLFAFIIIFFICYGIGNLIFHIGLPIISYINTLPIYVGLHLIGKKFVKPESHKTAQSNGEDFENNTTAFLKKYVDKNTFDNVIIPNGDKLPDGTEGSAELDTVLVNKKGIFCIECKYNAAGMMRPLFISIDDMKENWHLATRTELFYSQEEGSKTRIYYRHKTNRDHELAGDYEPIKNPFFQNEGHLQVLRNIYKDVPLFNVVISNNYIIDKNDTKINVYNGSAHMKDNRIIITNGVKGMNEFKELIDTLPDKVNSTTIYKISEFLKENRATEIRKKEHLEYIKKKYPDEKSA